MKRFTVLSIIFLLTACTWVQAEKGTLKKLDGYYSKMASTQKRALDDLVYDDYNDDGVPDYFEEAVGVWKAFNWDDFELNVNSAPSVQQTFVKISEYGVDFSGASGFISTGPTDIYPWCYIQDAPCEVDEEESDGEDGESRRVLTQTIRRRVLDGEDDGEDDGFDIDGRDGSFYEVVSSINFDLSNGIYVQLYGLSDDVLAVDFGDDSNTVNAGWINFLRWDLVAFEQDSIWGEWVEEGGSDSDTVLVSADWDGLTFGSDDTLAWYNVVSFEDEEEGYYVFCDGSGENAMDMTLCTGRSIAGIEEEETTGILSDDGTETVIQLKSTSTRKTNFYGSWTQYEVTYGDGYSVSDLPGSPADITIDSTGTTLWADTVTFASDAVFGALYYEVSFDCTSTQSVYITLGLVGEVLSAYVYDAAGGNLYAEIQYADISASWSCDSGNMGCESGTKVSSSGTLQDNGQYTHERTFDNSAVTIRKQSPTDDQFYSTVRPCLTQGATTFDIAADVIAIADESGSEADLCGSNALFKTADNINWLFSENTACYLKLKPFRGVQQAVQITYSGTVEEFIDDVIPEFFQALFDAIVVSLPDFVIEQLILSDCYIVSSRRLRVLDDAVQVEYNIEPVETSTESDTAETTSDFDDIVADLETAASAAETAMDTITLTGATIDASTFSSVTVAVIDDGTDDFFAPEDDEEEENEEGAGGDTPTSGNLMTFSTLIMTVLCLAVGLFGQ